MKRLFLLVILCFVFTLSNVVYSFKPFNIEVIASSYLNNDPKYSIDNIFDNNIKTCWAEGVPSNGSGIIDCYKVYAHCDRWYVNSNKKTAEMFMCEMPFPPKDMKITKIRIYNGYGKSDLLWKANNRVKKLGIEIYGFQEEIKNNDFSHTYNYRAEIPLQDKGWNDIELSDYFSDYAYFLYNGLNYIESVKFYILETYKGDKYNDTCISEIEFYNENEKYIINKVDVITTKDAKFDEEG